MKEVTTSSKNTSKISSKPIFEPLRILLKIWKGLPWVLLHGIEELGDSPLLMVAR
jgi:hypothetical protein